MNVRIVIPKLRDGGRESGRERERERGRTFELSSAGLFGIIVYYSTMTISLSTIGGNA